jgi:O-antigen ligase
VNDDARTFAPVDRAVANKVHDQTSVTKRAFLSSIKTWVLCVILLVLASTYGFSFERGSKNTTAGTAEQGVSAGNSEESGIIKLQKNAIYGLSILIMLPLASSIGTEFRHNLLISCLLVWAVLSFTWSADPTASLVTSLRMTVDVALAFYLFNRYSPNDLLKLLLLVGAMATVGSIVLILVFPQYGLMNREAAYAFGAWQGIFGQKNICGRMMTLLLLPIFFVKLEGRGARIFRFSYVMAVLIIVAMTRSAGSWMLCGACVAFVAAVHLGIKMKRIDALCLGLTLFGIVAAAVAIVLSNPGPILALVGKDPTMTGRTGIWSSLMVSISKRPMTGYGYFAFWEGLHGESANVVLQAHWPGMSYAENGVLELWLEVGAVAVALYALIFFTAVKDAFYCLRRYPSKSTMWYASILFYVGFTNLWAGNLLAASNLECIIPFLAYVGLRKEARRIRGLQVA